MTETQRGKLRLTVEQKNRIVELRETTSKKWPEIGKELGISGEDARRTYRLVTGTNKKAYLPEENPNTTFEQGDNFINIICSSPRMLTQEDVIEQFKIDLSLWEIDRFKVKTSEGYRKDRSVEWRVEDGTVTTGEVHDSGKMLVVPLYHVEVHLVKRKEVIAAKTIIDQMKEDAAKFAPVYPKITYPALQDGCLYEIDMVDIHFGRLTWEEESGESYDVKLARKAVESTLIKLLAYAKNHSITRILLPVGNDFFNVDNKLNTTTKGTPQQEDTRWQKTFRLGREMCVWMIDACSQVAPVDVLMIAGNHDEQRSFYLGDSLQCWYRNSQDVNIDNSARKQKYYAFGSNLIGFAHGADEALSKLPLLMAIDVPELWAKSKYREWHTGDKHHKKDLIPRADEAGNITVRILRALASADAWTFNNGYRSLRASEAFLWHPEAGLVAQYTAGAEI